MLSRGIRGQGGVRNGAAGGEDGRHQGLHRLLSDFAPAPSYLTLGHAVLFLCFCSFSRCALFFATASEFSWLVFKNSTFSVV